MAKLAHDGSSLSDTRMSFLELSHFCQKVGILDETLNEASLRKIFRWVDTDMSSSKKGGAGGAGSRRGGGKSTSSGGFKNGRDHALHRPEFMEALIHIAMSKVDMGGRGGQTGGGEAADERVRDSVCFCGGRMWAFANFRVQHVGCTIRARRIIGRHGKRHRPFLMFTVYTY